PTLEMLVGIDPIPVVEQRYDSERRMRLSERRIEGDRALGRSAGEGKHVARSTSAERRGETVSISKTRVRGRERRIRSNRRFKTSNGGRHSHPVLLADGASTTVLRF